MLKSAFNRMRSEAVACAIHSLAIFFGSHDLSLRWSPLSYQPNLPDRFQLLLAFHIPFLVKLFLSHKRCTSRLSVFVDPFFRVVLVTGIECHCICDDRATHTAIRISPISCITRTLIAKSGPEYIAFSVVAWLVWFRF